MGELAVVCAGLRDLHDDLDNAYQRRVELFMEGRALKPPLLHRELAEAAGVSDVAVEKALRLVRRATG